MTPSYYYNQCLRDFARFMAINYDNNERLANHFFRECEDSNEELEKYILKKRLETDNFIFFYDAGATSQRTLDDIGNDISNFNNCIDGIMQFEYLVGLPNREEDEEEEEE